MRGGGESGLRNVVVLAAAIASLGAAPSGRADFGAWLRELRTEAERQAISAATLDAALANVAPLERVIELDRKQPERSLTFPEYLDLVVRESRVVDGRERLAQNRELLDAIGARYGVDPSIVVALWGSESDFGRRTGTFRVVDALATLAWEGRRASFFRGELLDALRILDEGHVPPDRMLGSWAGAMGQPQFMPSSFRAYAVDHDGDSRRDIWGSDADALASAANYLARHGWKAGLPWGREVRLPEGFDAGLVGRAGERPLSAWAGLGVSAPGLAAPGAEAWIVRPGGESGRAFLVTGNYGVLLRWNRSDYFATAVGLLSDRLAGRSGPAPP